MSGHSMLDAVIDGQDHPDFGGEYEVPATGPLPYSRPGPVGSAWPQGHPGKLPTTVAGYVAEHEALADARTLLLEVLRSPKAYRGINMKQAKAGMPQRYTAIEITDDLAQRIALVCVGAALTSPYDRTEQDDDPAKPGATVSFIAGTRKAQRGVLIRKVDTTTSDHWFVQVAGTTEVWPRSTFRVWA